MPADPNNCWDTADRNISSYKTALERALRGEGKANPVICREKIDQWLEYRHAHGPNDESAL
jgi:hypothetical protein